METISKDTGSMDREKVKAVTFIMTKKNFSSANGVKINPKLVFILK